MGGDAPDPDPNIGIAAARTAELGERAFQWYLNEYNTTLKPEAERLSKLNEQGIEQALRIGDAQEQRAATAFQDYQTTFRPIEQSMAADAAKYNTDAERNRQAELAGAETQTAFDQSGQQLNRELARRGVQVNSGQAVSLAAGQSLARAAQTAANMNTARTNADAIGFAKKAAVAQVGRGISGDASAASQLALGAGGQASGLAQATSANSRANLAAGGQGFGTAMSGWGQAGSLWGQADQTRMAGYSADQGKQGAVIGAIGAVAAIAL